MCHWMTWKRFDGILVMKDFVHRALEFHAFWSIIIYILSLQSIRTLVAFPRKNFYILELKDSIAGTTPFSF